MSHVPFGMDAGFAPQQSVYAVPQRIEHWTTVTHDKAVAQWIDFTWQLEPPLAALYDNGTQTWKDGGEVSARLRGAKRRRFMKANPGVVPGRRKWQRDMDLLANPAPGSGVVSAEASVSRFVESHNGVAVGNVSPRYLGACGRQIQTA